MNATLIVVLLLVAGVGTALASGWLTRRDFLRRFESRPSLAPDEVLSELGPERITVLRGLWNKLESVLGVPKGKLRLTDRFKEELQPNKRFAICNPAAEAVEDLQECFPEERLEIVTLRDYCYQALRLTKSSTSETIDLAKLILG